MRKLLLILPLAIATLLPACTTKTEVVALQPVSKPAPKRVASSTTTVHVHKTGAPRPTPWATDVVNAYDEKRD